jgi:hypothetical protein
VLDPSQRLPNYDQLDERTDWFYEAIAASYAMITKTPGVGSTYLSTYRDKDGDWLDGGQSYRLRIEPDPPMQQFWAVSVYDIDTRTLFRNETLRAEVSSNSEGLQKNADGSVDVYFGPRISIEAGLCPTLRKPTDRIRDLPTRSLRSRLVSMSRRRRVLRGRRCGSRRTSPGRWWS